MSNKESGYIYILTNPSFREDWVKILLYFENDKIEAEKDIYGISS